MPFVLYAKLARLLITKCDDLLEHVIHVVCKLLVERVTMLDKNGCRVYIHSMQASTAIH